jgi:hypothetical protein
VRLPISYSALHASCRDLIEAVGLNPSKYSTHSAKRGSATATVVAGCTDAEVTAVEVCGDRKGLRPWE